MKQKEDSMERQPDFLKLWAGESVSLFGSQITTLALPLTAVLTLKATPLEVSLVMAARFAPFLLVTLLAGVWVERRRRRPVLIAANLGRAVLMTSIPILALTGLLRIEYLYMGAFLIGLFTVFFDLAYLSYLPALLRPTQLVAGNARLQASESAAEIGGPGLAGILVALVGAPLALLIDAFSFLVSVVSLLLIRPVEPAPVAPSEASNVWAEIREGLKLTLGNPYLRAFVGEAATYNFFDTIILTFFSVYAIRELDLGPALIGLIMAGGGAGALVGALLTGYVARRWGVGRTIIASASLSCLMPLVIPAVSGDRPVVVGLLLVSYFLTGLGVTGTNVHTISLRQTITPPHLLGRVNASYRFVASSAVVGGAIFSGVLGDWLGLRLALTVGAVGLLLPVAWLWFSPVPRLRDLNQVEIIGEARPERETVGEAV